MADGETVDRAPEAVVLVLDERPIAMGLQVVVTGPAGPIQTGSPTRSHFGPARLNAEAPAGSTPSPGGVTSADGDPGTGTLPLHGPSPPQRASAVQVQGSIGPAAVQRSTSAAADRRTVSAPGEPTFSS